MNLSERKHAGVTCDGCGITSFTGLRHTCFILLFIWLRNRCTVCYDYDLCDSCKRSHVETKEHEASHPMDSISAPSHDFGNNIGYLDSSIQNFLLNPLDSALEALIPYYLDWDYPLKVQDLIRVPFVRKYIYPNISEFTFKGGFGEYGLSDHVFSRHPDDTRPVVH